MLPIDDKATWVFQQCKILVEVESQIFKSLSKEIVQDVTYVKGKVETWPE